MPGRDVVRVSGEAAGVAACGFRAFVVPLSLDLAWAAVVLVAAGAPDVGAAVGAARVTAEVGCAVELVVIGLCLALRRAVEPAWDVVGGRNVIDGSTGWLDGFPVDRPASGSSSPRDGGSNRDVGAQGQYQRAAQHDRDDAGRPDTALEDRSSDSRVVAEYRPVHTHRDRSVRIANPPIIRKPGHAKARRRAASTSLASDRH